MSIQLSELHRLYISIHGRAADNTGFGYWEKVREASGDELALGKYASFFVQDREARKYSLIKQIQESKEDLPTILGLLSDKTENGLLFGFAGEIFKNLTGQSSLSDEQKAKVLDLLTSTFSSENESVDQVFDALGTFIASVIRNFSNDYSNRAVKVSEALVKKLNELGVRIDQDKISDDGVFYAAEVFSSFLELAKRASDSDIDAQIASVLDNYSSAEDIVSLIESGSGIDISSIFDGSAPVVRAPTTGPIVTEEEEGKKEEEEEEEKGIPPAPENQIGVTTDEDGNKVVDAKEGVVDEKEPISVNINDSNIVSNSSVITLQENVTRSTIRGNAAEGEEQRVKVVAPEIELNVAEIPKVELSENTKKAEIRNFGEGSTSVDVNADEIDITTEKVGNINLSENTAKATIRSETKAGEGEEETVNVAAPEVELAVEGIDNINLSENTKKADITGDADTEETVNVGAAEAELTVRDIDNVSVDTAGETAKLDLTVNGDNKTNIQANNSKLDFTLKGAVGNLGLGDKVKKADLHDSNVEGISVASGNSDINAGSATKLAFEPEDDPADDIDSSDDEMPVNETTEEAMRAAKTEADKIEAEDKKAKESVRVAKAEIKKVLMMDNDLDQLQNVLRSAGFQVDESKPKEARKVEIQENLENLFRLFTQQTAISSMLSEAEKAGLEKRDREVDRLIKGFEDGTIKNPGTPKILNVKLDDASKLKDVATASDSLVAFQLGKKGDGSAQKFEFDLNKDDPGIGVSEDAFKKLAEELSKQADSSSSGPQQKPALIELPATRVTSDGMLVDKYQDANQFAKVGFLSFSGDLDGSTIKVNVKAREAGFFEFTSQGGSVPADPRNQTMKGAGAEVEVKLAEGSMATINFGPSSNSGASNQEKLKKLTIDLNGDRSGNKSTYDSLKDKDFAKTRDFAGRYADSREVVFLAFDSPDARRNLPVGTSSDNKEYIDAITVKGLTYGDKLVLAGWSQSTGSKKSEQGSGIDSLFKAGTNGIGKESTAGWLFYQDSSSSSSSGTGSKTVYAVREDGTNSLTSNDLVIRLVFDNSVTDVEDAVKDVFFLS